MVFDKIMSVEDQYKELGANDSEFEDKLQNAFVQASNISGHMKTTLEQYNLKAFHHYNNINILIEVKMFKTKIL